MATILDYDFQEYYANDPNRYWPQALTRANAGGSTYNTGNTVVQAVEYETGRVAFELHPSADTVQTDPATPAAVMSPGDTNAVSIIEEKAALL